MKAKTSFKHRAHNIVLRTWFQVVNKVIASVIITLLLLNKATLVSFTKKLSQSVLHFCHVHRSRVNRSYNVVRSVGPYFSIAGLIQSVLVWSVK